jgi:2'-hydroxyisoflavone reductase
VRILVIGGTVFVGRHLTAAALAKGHEVTLFNRGQHNPELFPEVDRIQGDRAKDLDRLTGTWDVVVDTCGYFPRDVRASALALFEKVQHYVFVSSLSVFPDAFTTPGITEEGRLGVTEDGDATEVTGENYGPLKVLCEQAAEEILPNRTLVMRPGLIVGPHDPTDRFTYWPERMSRGGSVLAPAPSEETVQIVDVRDLVEFTLMLIESKQVGRFNVTGSDYPLTMGRCLEACIEAAGVDSNVVWVDPDWLIAREVKPWTELPLWVPDSPGFSRFDCSKAISAGLRFRPIEATAQDTLNWAVTRHEHEWKGGLSAPRETELLEAWAQR